MPLVNMIRINPFTRQFVSLIYRSLGGGSKRCKGRNNTLVRRGTFMRGCRFIVNGNNNSIVFEESAYKISGMKVTINGNNNILHVGSDFATSGLSFTMEDDNNKILIGDGVHGGGSSEFAAIEGTTISIGNGCMLSANITIRTGDSHSILDASTKERINPSKSVYIEENVWLGNTVLIFKGCRIGAHSIVAGGAVVTGKTFPKNCIIGGNPAIVIKDGVDWCSKRL